MLVGHMAVQLDIGPSGQPPTTTYYYDAGVVALSDRPATVRSASQVVSIVDNIRLFQRAVLTSDPSAPVVAIGDPFKWTVQYDAGNLVCQFRCQGTGGAPPYLTVEVEQNISTRVTSFAAREGRDIAWGDFLLFVRWMEFIRHLATRPQD